MQSCPSYPANSSQTTRHTSHDISQCLSRQGSETSAYPATGKCRDIGLRPESGQFILASVSPRPGRRAYSSDLIATLAFMQVFKVTVSSPGCHPNTETQESSDQSTKSEARPCEPSQCLQLKNTMIRPGPQALSVSKVRMPHLGIYPMVDLGTHSTTNTFPRGRPLK